MQAQREPAGLGPGAWKKVHVVFKQEKTKKTIIIAFIEHLLVPGTLHTSVLSNKMCSPAWKLSKPQLV